MKKSLNLRISTVLTFTLSAALMVLTAVSELTGWTSQPAVLVLSLCLFALWLVVAILSWRRGEGADEMARKNMLKASFFCFSILILAGIAAGLYCALSGHGIFLTVPVIFLLLACIYLLYAALFYLFDRWGDKLEK